MRSSGLHDLVFDDMQVMPAWSEMALDAHHNFIARQLKETHSLYISGLDAEIDWLSTLDLSPADVLNPNLAALAHIQKPRISCAADLDMEIPDFLPVTASQTELHSLARRYGWRVWIKGKFHEAYAATSYREMMIRINQMQVSWPIEDIFLQRNVTGHERSFTFAAFNGELIGVAEIEKRSQTPAGKTWTAEVLMPSSDVVARIVAFVKRTNWTGGGEIEFIRDCSGRDWLIDVNPRFPAYIHGVTICGLNLPGMLISAAMGDQCLGHVPFGGQFTRIVSEISVRPNSCVPPIAVSEISSGVNQKHPSFQPLLVNKRRKVDGLSFNKRRDFVNRSSMLGTRPVAGGRIRESKMEFIFASLEPMAEVLDDLSSRIRITPALSIKTDPQEFLAQAYLSRGWYAEAISSHELSWAKGVGFKSNQLILNGPAAASLATTTDSVVRYAFADSLISLKFLAQNAVKTTCGIRIRPNRVESRFGIDLTDYSNYISTLDAIASLGSDGRFAAHFHLSADQIGPDVWMDCFEEAISWISIISKETGVRVSAIDIGGGWHADDFVNVLFPLLKEKIVDRIADISPSVELIFEPGKAVSSNLARFTANVVEVRHHANNDAVEVLVDCSIADLPMTQFYAHKVEHYRGSRYVGALSGGKDRILGSICMEADILASGVSFPESPESGDRLDFCGAGAYNSSMAWPFAKGITRD